MKKYLSSMLLSAAAIISATMSVSCGEEDDDNGLTPEQPVEKVVMGKGTSLSLQDLGQQIRPKGQLSHQERGGGILL